MKVTAKTIGRLQEYMVRCPDEYKFGTFDKMMEETNCKGPGDILAVAITECAFDFGHETPHEQASIIITYGLVKCSEVLVNQYGGIFDMTEVPKYEVSRSKDRILVKTTMEAWVPRVKNLTINGKPCDSDINFDSLVGVVESSS